MKNEKLEEIYSALSTQQPNPEEQVKEPEEITEEVDESQDEVDEEQEVDVDEEEVDETSEVVSTDDSEVDEEANEQDNIIEEWDDSIDEEEQEAQNTIDFNELSKDLNVEVKSKDELLVKFKELQDKVSNYESESNQYANLPEDLKAAIDLAKNGGDYLSYLDAGAVDYDQVGDREMLEFHYQSMFDNTEEGREELLDYLDSMSDAQLKINARQVRQQLKSQQEQRKSQIKESSDKQKQMVVSGVKDAVSKLDKVGDFKVKPSHKSRIEKAILDGSLSEYINGGSNGNYDFNKMVENAFKIMYYDNITSYLKTKVANSTKRDIIEKTSNASIKRPAKKPEAKKEKKSGLDSYFESLKTRKNNF